MPTVASLKPYQSITILCVLSNLAIVFAHTTWLILPAAGLLFGFLPGFLLIRLLLGRYNASLRAERIVLGAAVSYGLSSVAVLGVHFLPGPMTLASILIAIDLMVVVLVGLTIVLDRRAIHGERTHREQHTTAWQDLVWVLLPFVVLLALIIVFRFFSLNYSEYQGDEIDVTGLARLAIAGQADALFLHRKGPVELVIAATFALFARSFDEFALRFPFALASGWAIIGTYVLGRRLWGTGLGLFAAALLALNGIFLGFSRMVQYQGVVALLLVSAVLCFYVLNRGSDRKMEPRLVVLGLGLWGTGLLSHYEAGLIGVVLAYLYLQKYPFSNWSWSLLRPLVIAAGVLVLVLLAYYVPFVTHVHFADTFQRYTEIRISPDRMPFNNLGDYLTSSLFYNSIYYETVMVLGLLLAAWYGLQHVFTHRAVPLRRERAASFSWTALIVWGTLFAGLIGGTLAPSWLQIGGMHVSLFLVLPAMALLTFNRTLSLGLKMAFLWFDVYLVAYAFLIRIPGLHYYTLLPAWVLLAAWGLGQAAGRLSDRSLVWHWGIVGTGVVLGVSLLFHPYLLFVRTSPEYALSYPEHSHPIYWNTSSGQPERFFGLPHRSGWKTIGYLFEQGVLAGDFRSNEKEEIATWYARRGLSESDRPVYYLIADNATEKPHKQDYPAELLAAEYAEIGGVSVSAQQRLHIFQQKPAGEDIGVLPDEDYSHAYLVLSGLQLPEGAQP